MMVNKTRSSKDAIQCNRDLITYVSHWIEERRAAGLLPSEADLVKYSVLLSFSELISEGVHRKYMHMHRVTLHMRHLAHALTCVTLHMHSHAWSTCAV